MVLLLLHYFRVFCPRPFHLLQWAASFYRGARALPLPIGWVGVGVAAFSHAPEVVGAPRGRDGAGAAAERLPGGQRGVRGVPPGVPRAPGAVPGLAAGGAAVPGHRRAQRHVPGHLLQGRAALGPHGAAEGAGPRRAALLQQLREQEGPRAGLQPLRLPGFLLGAALPPGAHRGLGAAPARGGIRSLLPEPAQGQPDRGPGQPAEHGHPRPRVPAEEERGAGGAVPGQGSAPAGLLGRVPGGAGGGGVLAGPIEPAARPDRVPAGPGPRGAARGHDAPGPRRLGLRAPLALSPPPNVPKECPQVSQPPRPVPRCVLGDGFGAALTSSAASPGG